VGQFGRERRQPIEVAICPAEFDVEVLAFDITGFLQPLAQGRDQVRERRWRGDAKKTDQRWRLPLLRARGKRPRNRRPEHPPNQFAPPHAITSSASDGDGALCPFVVSPGAPFMAVI
jgi:hypothetical protein